MVDTSTSNEVQMELQSRPAANGKKLLEGTSGPAGKEVGIYL